MCGKFKKEHWGHRWYNRREYNVLYPNMSTHNSNENYNIINDIYEGNDTTQNTTLNVARLPPNNGMVEDDNDLSIDQEAEGEATTVFNSILDANNSKVGYNDVLEIATDLCRTVSDDPILCKHAYGTIFEWIGPQVRLM